MGGCRPQSDSALWWTYGALWFLLQKQSVFFILNYQPAMQETQLYSLGWEDPLEKEMATYWRIPWTEEAAELQSMRSQRVRHD